MLTHRPIAFLAVFALAASSFFSTDAGAETVIKFDLAGSPAPDVAYNSGALGTVDDGLSTGDKTTDVKYFGFLDFLPDIVSGASLTLTGVTANGSASIVGGSIVVQETTGGMFSLYDPGSVLLLSGDIGTGVITGSTSSTTGAFATNSAVNYTGGSLLPLLQPDSGALSLSFTNVRTNGSAGMVVDNGTLLNFSATANGALDASAVPEPSVIGMAAIGALALVRRHRRRRKAAAL